MLFGTPVDGFVPDDDTDGGLGIVWREETVSVGAVDGRAKGAGTTKGFFEICCKGDASFFGGIISLCSVPLFCDAEGADVATPDSGDDIGWGVCSAPGRFAGWGAFNA